MGLIPTSILAVGSVPPLTPDGDDAREWAERELADPVYRAAEPTFFDRIAQAVVDVIVGLFQPQDAGAWGGPLAIIAAVVVVVVIVAAIIVWGLPRSTRRARPPVAVLFGDAEERSASELRRDAAYHADKGEWDAAIVLRFRALARGVSERGIVDVPPGATVHAFGRAAACAFPAQAAELEAAADAFDDVRYLRRPGTLALYERVAAVDDRVAAARPLTVRTDEALAR